MVDTVEVENETEDGGKSGERSKQTANISQVVQHIVHNSLNEQAVLVKFKQHTRRNLVYSVVRISRWANKLFNQREYIFLMLQE